MKKRKFVSCLTIAALLVFSATLLVLAAQQVPDEVALKPSIWPNPTKAAVKLSHKKHHDEYKVACNECHHVMKDGKNTWKEGDEVRKCEACHTEATTQGELKLPPDRKKLNLKIAFHTECQSCHKKLRAEKPDINAPATCTQCHSGPREG